MEAAVKKTWMPTVAGILDIVAGGLSLSVLFLFAIGPMIIMPLNTGTFSLNWSLFLMVIPGLAILSLRELLAIGRHRVAQGTAPHLGAES